MERETDRRRNRAGDPVALSAAGGGGVNISDHQQPALILQLFEGQVQIQVNHNTNHNSPPSVCFYTQTEDINSYFLS